MTFCNLANCTVSPANTGATTSLVVISLVLVSLVTTNFFLAFSAATSALKVDFVHYPNKITKSIQNQLTN
jgi:hypothetical protein